MNEEIGELRAQGSLRGRREAIGWTAAAVLMFGICSATLFHGFWGQDFSEVVPAAMAPDRQTGVGEYPGGVVGESDHQFVIWLVAHNARALLRDPLHMFDAEVCYPAKHALAYGESVVNLGVLGVPAYAWTNDPISTFNFVSLALPFVAALAMYLLVWDWTRIAAAGIVAAVLYGFHVLKVFDVSHPYGYDTAWTVFAMLFARRLFSKGRWRDACGLILSCSMQIAGSLYPLVASALLAIPILAWLLIHYGVRHLRIGQCALVVGMLALITYLIFSPYLELRRLGVLQARRVQVFLPWTSLLPGEPRFPGWVALALALAAFLRTRRPTFVPVHDGNPRWALLAAGWLVLSVCSGNPSDLTQPAALNLYARLAVLIPGLDVVRVPGALYTGAHIALCILAGYGAATLVRRTRRPYTISIAVALIALAYIDTLRPAWLGMQPRVIYTMFPLRPNAESLAFFEELARRGNTGPIVEMPDSPTALSMRAAAMLLSAYHHRPTSACDNSFVPPVIDKVVDLGTRLPNSGAVEGLREMGFTTVVLHHAKSGNPGMDNLMQGMRRTFDEAGAPPQNLPFRRVYGSDALTAYELLVPGRDPGQSGATR